MTKKPCPGCGKRIPREADKVCQFCASAIKSWNAHKEVVALRQYSVGYARHINSIPHAPGVGEALHDIAVEVSSGAPTDVPLPAGYKTDIFPRKFSCEMTTVVLTEPVAAALSAAYDAVVSAIDDARARGKADGRNLLLGLNDGSISMDDYVRRAT